jgi:hypothetical protein
MRLVILDQLHQRLQANSEEIPVAKNSTATFALKGESSSFAKRDGHSMHPA